MQSGTYNDAFYYQVNHNGPNDFVVAEAPPCSDNNAQSTQPPAFQSSSFVPCRDPVEEHSWDGRRQYDVSTPAPVDQPLYYLSSTFSWDVLDANGNAPDLDLIAGDGVHFAAHLTTLGARSSNGFGGLISSTSTIAVPLSSSVLNLILHAVYGLSPAQYSPSVNELATAVDALEPYGLSKATFVSPSTPLFQLISHRAPAEPLACYALAAHAELENLAVIISSYTLDISLSDISDALAVHIGPHYLKRLFFLHLGRVDALKRLLLPPPGPHPPTEVCSLRAQRQLSRAWTAAVADMTWDLSAGITVPLLEQYLRPIEMDFSCTECRKYLGYRTRELLVEWSLVKNTI